MVNSLYPLIQDPDEDVIKAPPAPPTTTNLAAQYRYNPPEAVAQYLRGASVPSGAPPLRAVAPPPGVTTPDPAKAVTPTPEPPALQAFLRQPAPPPVAPPAQIQPAPAPVDLSRPQPNESADDYLKRAVAMNAGDWSAGWNVGVRSLKSLGAGAAAAVGQAVGSDTVREWGLDHMKRLEGEMQPYQVGRPTKIEDIKSLGQAVDYAQYTLAQVAPSIIESIGTGLVGAAIGSAMAPGAGTAGGAAAGLIAKGGVKSLLGKYIAKETADRMATGQIVRAVAEQQASKAVGAKLGAMTAMFGSSYLQGVGDIYGETLDDAGKGNLLTSFAGAVPYAAFDALTEIALVGSGKIVKGTVGEKAVQRYTRAILGNALMEGSTEAAQEGLVILAGLNEGKEYSKAEVISQLGNGFAAGFLAGGVMGAPAGRKQAPERPGFGEMMTTVIPGDGPIGTVERADVLAAMTNPLTARQERAEALAAYTLEVKKYDPEIADAFTKLAKTAMRDNAPVVPDDAFMALFPRAETKRPPVTGEAPPATPGQPGPVSPPATTPPIPPEVSIEQEVPPPGAETPAPIAPPAADAGLTPEGEIAPVAPPLTPEAADRQQGEAEYQTRYQDRVARVQAATTPEEVDAILTGEEYQDPERHIAGTTKVEKAAKEAKQKLATEATRAEAENRGEWVTFPGGSPHGSKQRLQPILESLPKDDGYEYKLGPAVEPFGTDPNNRKYRIERRKIAPAVNTPVEIAGEAPAAEPNPPIPTPGVPVEAPTTLTPDEAQGQAVEGAKSFVPTHTDSTGTPLRATDKPGLYIDEAGDEVEDSAADPITPDELNAYLASRQQETPDEAQGPVEPPAMPTTGVDMGQAADGATPVTGGQETPITGTSVKPSEIDWNAELTTEDVQALEGIPTPTRMQMAIEAVGEEELARRMQARVDEEKRVTKKDALDVETETALVESVAVGIAARVAKAQRQQTTAQIQEAPDAGTLREDAGPVRGQGPEGQPGLQQGAVEGGGNREQFTPEGGQAPNEAQGQVEPLTGGILTPEQETEAVEKMRQARNPTGWLRGRYGRDTLAKLQEAGAVDRLVGVAKEKPAAAVEAETKPAETAPAAPNQLPADNLVTEPTKEEAAWTPPTDPALRADFRQMLEDNIATRRDMGVKVPGAWIERLEQIKAADAGISAEVDEIVPRQVFGHPMQTDTPEYANLVPIKFRKGYDFSERIAHAENLVNNLQTKFGRARAIEAGRIKTTPKEKRAQLAWLKSANATEEQHTLDRLKGETIPELYRLAELSMPPQASTPAAPTTAPVEVVAKNGEVLKTFPRREDAEAWVAKARNSAAWADDLGPDPIKETQALAPTEAPVEPGAPPVNLPEQPTPEIAKLNEVRDAKFPAQWEGNLRKARVAAKSLIDAGLVPEAMQQRMKERWSDAADLTDSIKSRMMEIEAPAGEPVPSVTEDVQGQPPAAPIDIRAQWDSLNEDQRREMADAAGLPGTRLAKMPGAKLSKVQVDKLQGQQALTAAQGTLETATTAPAPAVPEATPAAPGEPVVPSYLVDAENKKQAQREVQLKPGESLGTLILAGTLLADTKIDSVTPDGVVKLTGTRILDTRGKRGNTMRGELDVARLPEIMDNTQRRGQRPDSYQDFLASRQVTAPAVEQAPEAKQPETTAPEPVDMGGPEQPASAAVNAGTPPKVSWEEAVNLSDTGIDELLSQFDEPAAAAMPATEQETTASPRQTRSGTSPRPASEGTPEQTTEPRKPSLARSASLLVEGTEDLASGILNLFSGKGTLRSGPAFDEEAYAKAKPMFASAMQKYKEAGREFTEWLTYLIKQGGDAIKPAVRRFLQDVRDGEVHVPGVNDEKYAEAQDAKASEAVTEPEKPDQAPEPEKPDQAPEAEDVAATEDATEPEAKPEKPKKPRAKKGEGKTPARKDGERVPRTAKDRGAGTVVVRPMDAIRRALAALRATDDKHYVEAALKAANPAKVWKIPEQREGVTPGALRAQMAIRNRLIGPLEHLGARAGGRRGKYRLSFLDALVQDLRYDEQSTSKEQARDKFEGKVANYISTIEALGAKLSGAGNVAQVAEAFREFITPDADKRAEFQRSARQRAEHGYSEYDVDQQAARREADDYGKALIDMRRPSHNKQGYVVDDFWLYYVSESEQRSPWYQFLAKENDQVSEPIVPKRELLKDIRRTGFADVRNGEEITSERLMAEFGFAAVPVGDWVTSKSGSLHLNSSFEALHDLAELIGANPKTDISFGGELHYSIGRLGRGGPHSAFFAPQWPIFRRTEDNKEVLGSDGMPIVDGHIKAINITKTSGDGSVAHEWGHAFDDALSATDEGQRMVVLVKNALRSGYDIARLEKVLDEILVGARVVEWDFDPKTKKGRLDAAMKFLNGAWTRDDFGVFAKTKFAEEAEKLGEYWSRPQELWARSWESTLYDWIGAGRDSQYLVNDYVQEGKFVGLDYRGDPYPSGMERQTFSAMWRDVLSNVEWVDGKPHAKASFKDPLEAQKAAIKEQLTILKEKVQQRYAELNGIQSDDGLYWYAYTEDRRGPGAQPNGYVAFDDAYTKDGADESFGAVAYIETLGPEDVRASMIEPIKHEASDTTIYLKENESGGIDSVGTPGFVGAEDEPTSRVPGTAPDKDTDSGGDADTGAGKGPNVGSGGGWGAGQSGAGAGVSGTPESADGGRGAGDAGEVSASEPRNYHVTEPDALRPSGLAEAFTDNLRAIKLLKQLEAEGRLANQDEQAVLMKYHGWGGLDKAFKYRFREADQAWERRAEALREVLTDEELTEARASTINANYTDPAVVAGMWETLERMGFKGGRVLDPSGGNGLFFAMMPQELERASKMMLIDKDSLSARISAQILQKTAVKHAGFEDVRLPERYFDLVVSNIPFADISPVDKKYNKKRRFLHDYFFMKSIELVRPGGIVAFITSKGTMDKVKKGGPEIRAELMEKADLIGALRLPENAFKESGMTTVTTDIIFLRRKAGAKATDLTETWGESKPMVLEPNEEVGRYGEFLDEEGDDNSVPRSANINEYYHRHPEQMATRMIWRRGRYGGAFEPAMEPSDVPIGELVAPMLRRLPGDVMIEEGKAAFDDQSMYAVTAEVGDVKDGGFAEQDGKLWIKRGDMLLPYETRKPANEAIIRSYLKVMRARREVLNSELRQFTDKELDALRQALRDEYQAFVDAHGPLNTRENKRVILEDPDSAAVLALEDWDVDSKNVKKLADIFTRRVVALRSAPTHADNALDAMAASLNYKGRVDWPYIQKLTGKRFESARAELRGMIYNDPMAGWVTSDEYLSGNVREKLDIARASAEIDDQYQENVEALEAVQPADLSPKEIHLSLGSSWMPASVVRDFVGHLLGLSHRGQQILMVSYAKPTGEWTVQIGGENQAQAKRNKQAIMSSTAATTTWGTPDQNVLSLIEYALNGGVPRVTRQVETISASGNKSSQTVLDEAATEAARVKLDAIKAELQKWAWTDADRANTLVNLYNKERNNTVLRTYDHPYYKAEKPELAFPGMSPNERLRSYQAAFVWRVQQDLDAYAGHEVGTGKTFTLITAGMELLRTGVKKKLMYAVPNSMVSEWRENFLRLYPNANVLSIHIGEKALDRRVALAKIANNNWDAVIVTHNGFNRIPVSPATQMARISEQLVELEEALREAEAEDMSGGERRYGSRGKAPPSLTVKKLEKAKQRLESKLKELSEIGDKDDNVTFEELGIDQIFVDEAHAFKNLAFSTKLTGTVKGLGNPEGSGGAWDLFVKARYIQEAYGGGVVFASGTPVTNSVAEVFTIQRFLDYASLKNQGLHHFDRWVVEYGDLGVETMPLPEGGGFREETMFRSFHNAPELLKDVYRRLDVMSAVDAGIPRPIYEGGKPEQIVVPQTPALTAFQEELISRAKEIRRNRDAKHNGKPDNMLNIVTDGRKAAMDMRMIDPATPDHPDSKTNVAVKMILDEYKRTTDIEVTTPAGETIKTNGVVLVFADLGVPNKEGRFSIYEDIRKKLIAGGIPAREIAFGQEHSGNTDEKKAARSQQHAKVRAGKIRVYIGSTETMGTGVNVQDRVSMLLHLDVWWNLAKWLQRNGRGIRYGNLFKSVRVYNIGAERTIDTFVWGKIEQKQVLVDRLMSKNISDRTIEDISADTMSAGEAMAVFSGDPRIKRHANLKAEVRRLGALRVAYREQQRLTWNKIRGGQPTLDRLLGEIPNAGDYLARIEDVVNDGALLIFEPKRATATAFSFQEDAQNARAWKIAKAMIDAYQKETDTIQERNRIRVVAAREKYAAEHGGKSMPDALVSELYQPLPKPVQVGVFASGAMTATWTIAPNWNGKVTTTIATKEAKYEFSGDSTPRAIMRDLYAHVAEQNEDRVRQIKMLRRELPLLREEYAKPFEKEQEFVEKSAELETLTNDLLQQPAAPTVVVKPADAGREVQSPDQVREVQSSPLPWQETVIDWLNSASPRQTIEFELNDDDKTILAADLASYLRGETLDNQTEIDDEVAKAALSKSVIGMALDPEDQAGDDQKLALKIDRIIEGIDLGNLKFWARRQNARAMGQADVFDADTEGNAIRFSKNDTQSAPSGLPAESPTALRTAVARAMAPWANAPDWVVFSGMNDPDVPAAVRARYERALQARREADPQAQGDVVEGFWYRGAVYINAQAVRNRAALERVLRHEVLGHAGLRGLFGAGLEPLLDRIVRMRRPAVEAKAKAYGLDMNDPQQARSAAEEVLANWAEAYPTMGFVQELVALIKAKLREWGVLNADQMSDAEILREYVIPARNFIERGQVQAPGMKDSLAVAFMRRTKPNPQSTVRAYKLFRMQQDRPGELFPLYVDMEEGKVAPTRRLDPNRHGPSIPIGSWQDAEEGQQSADTKTGRPQVKSSLGDLARRPGFHAGDLPMATHIGGDKMSRFDAESGTMKALPTSRLPDQVWAEVEYAADVDWQAEANSRASRYKTSNQKTGAVKGAIVPKTAAITDQIPVDGFYRYKTNPNMTGNWLIGGAMRVVRILSDAEVKSINDAAGVADLPRKVPLDLKKYGFDDTAVDGQGGALPAIRTNEDIRYSLASEASRMATEARMGLVDAMDRFRERAITGGFQSTNLSLLNRTIGTPFHIAKKFPETFGKVFKHILSYSDTLAQQAISAERLAPSWFVDLEHGVLKSGESAVRVFRTTKKASMALLSKAINNTTLQKSLLSEAELRQRGLNDAQIGAYHQAFLAAHRSLDQTAQTFQAQAMRGLFNQLFAAYGMPEKRRRELASKLAQDIMDKDVTQALENAIEAVAPEIARLEQARAETIGLLRDARKELKEAEGRHDPKRQEDAQEAVQKLVAERDALTQMMERIGHATQYNADSEIIKRRTGTIGKIETIAERVNKLRQDAYFPLSRYGRYTLTVFNNQAKAGEDKVVFFAKYDSVDAQQAAYNELKDTLAEGQEIVVGTANREAYTLFQGINLDTLQLFADQLDTTDEASAKMSEMMREYIRLATSEANAMKHFLERKGTPGYSEDTQRVLADFIVANARLAATNLHSGDITASIAQDIPQQAGDLAEYATKLSNYLKQPTEEFSGIRNFMFLWYLGGSVSAALVNLTQVPMVTLPTLSQYKGGAASIPKAYKRVMAGLPSETNDKGDPAFANALQKARLDGIIAPQAVYELTATARGGTLGTAKLFNNPAMAFAKNVWSSMFAAAESLNREVTFTAAWMTAQGNGMNDQAAYDFAVDIVEQTQYMYARHNRSTFGRGIGAPIMTFTSFVIQTIELWSRLPVKQQLMMGGLLIMAAGLTGLPGEEDLEDLIDTIAQTLLGRTFQSREALEDFVYMLVGEAVGDVLLEGVTGLPGFPIDLQSRLGMQDLIPGTGILRPGNVGDSREVANMFGPISGIAKDVASAVNAFSTGDGNRLAYALAPRAIKNLMDGSISLAEGVQPDRLGRPIMEVSTLEALGKAIGFQPARVGRVQEDKFRLMRRDAHRRAMESAMLNRMARAAVKDDGPGVQAARREIVAWNQRNPQDPIRWTRAQLKQRIRALRMMGNERFLRSMSPELREEAARALGM